MTFDGRLRFVVLGALCVLFFVLNAATFNALGVVLPYMVEDLGWTWAIAGVGFTLLGVACGLSGLMPAILIRRFGVSRTMLAGGALALAGFGCMAVTTTAIVYFAGTILLGIAFTVCGQVPAVSVISHSFSKHSTAMGIYFTSGSLGSVAGPLIAYSTQEFMGNWRIYWVGAAIATVLLSVFTAMVTANRWNNRDASSDAARAAAQTGWSLRNAIRTPQYFIVVGAYSSFLLINTTVHGFAVQHMADLEISMGAAASVMSIIALISAGGSIVAGVAGERIKPMNMVLVSLGSTLIGVIALAFGANFAVLALASVGLGIGFGFSYVSIAVLLLDLFGKRPNLELYSTMSLISTSAAIGPALGGYVRDQTGSFSFVFLACALVALIFFTTLLFMKRPKEPNEDKNTADSAIDTPNVHQALLQSERHQRRPIAEL
ncbi:CynX/NimT family MFS transporter [Aurantiacibacter flavus]|uniref:MFS transporter n=1 Tax=Aurantiacibacter flavus TaxID=3145232 RepID=A0ABV0D0F5_9SPHN